MRFWIAATALLGLVALGLTMAPRVIDWNAYRADVETAAAALLGHDVVIAGPIALTFLPRTVLTARDVRVSSKAGSPIGFALDANQMEATLDIGPLLAGRPRVRALRLKRPVLSVDRDSSRRLRSWLPRWQDWTAPFSMLDLNAISFADGRIELAGDRQDQALSLSDLSLEIGIEGPNGPLEAAGLFKTKRHSFTIAAAFGRPDRDGLSAARLTIDARNGIKETTTLRFNGGITPFGEDRGFGGRLTLNGPDLQHGLGALSAATGYPSTFRSIAPAQPFSVEGHIDADREGIRTDDLQLMLSEKLGKGRIALGVHPKERLDIHADLPTLHLADDGGLKDFLPLDLLSKLRVPPGNIDIRLREVVYRKEAARKANIRLETGQNGLTTVKQAKAQLPGLVDVGFEGGLHPSAIGPRLSGKLAAVGDDLFRSLAWLGLVDGPANRSDRDGGWRGFSLESEVDVSSVEVALSSIDMRLDSSKLSGKASLRFAERQRLSLDLDVGRANLDLYLGELNARDTATAVAARLHGLDAKIDLRFERLIWQSVQVEEGRIRAGAEAGRMTLHEIDATTVGDTTLSLRGTIDLERRAADLGGELTSEHPARALRHLKLDLPLSSSRLRAIKVSGDISGTFERFEVAMEAGYDQGEARIDGQAGWIEGQTWYDLRVDARHPNHLALASQFGLAPLVPAGDAEGPFELAGRLSHRATTPWTAAGSAKLGPTTFTGSFSYKKAPESGPFEAKLSIGAPQKDSLAPFLILSGLRLAGDWTPERWLGRLPSVGLRTAWLDQAEGTLSLASKGGLVGDGLTLKARLADGLLYVDQLEASPWEGRLEAELSLERRRDRPFIAVAVELEQVRAQDFADWLGVKQGIDGPLDFRIEASSVGRTPYEMMAGLAGEIEIGAGPGELEGLGVPALKEILTSAAGDTAAADRSLTLPFSEIAAEAALSRGILTFEGGRLVLDPKSGEKISMSIDGTADLLLWIVDLTLSAIPDDADALTDDADALTDDADATNPAGPAYRVVGPPDRPDGFISTGN